MGHVIIVFTINSVYGNLTDQMKPDVCKRSPKLYFGTMETAFVGVATNYHQYQLC